MNAPQMDHRELSHKIVLATAILERERLIGPFGHPSLRVPRSDLIAILGHTGDHVRALAQSTVDDVVLIDLDGNVIAGDADPPGERYIHTEIYRSRPDVGAVVHAHPMGCIAFSIAGVAIRPIWHLCTLFAAGIPIHESSVQIDNPELGRCVAATLGKCKAVLLKGHGVAVTGSTIEEATVSAVNLERSARLQLMVESIGTAHEIPRSELTEDLLTIGLTADEYANAQWGYWVEEMR